MTQQLENLTPRQIVAELDKYIVGQDGAKRAVAVALRNRFRRAQLEETMREDIIPKNILMIGPTGVGKTEIARRLANLAKAPMLKVEATKFTEVGYVGNRGRFMNSTVDLNQLPVERLSLGSLLQQRIDSPAVAAVTVPPLPKPKAASLLAFKVSTAVVDVVFVIGAFKTILR